jgi:hypothetical protein
MQSKKWKKLQKDGNPRAQKKIPVFNMKKGQK